MELFAEMHHRAKRSDPNGDQWIPVSQDEMDRVQELTPPWCRFIHTASGDFIAGPFLPELRFRVVESA